jgi:PRTRC genetic system protein F
MNSKSMPIARAAAPDCFLIPAIDPEIPGRFSQDASRSQLLARFTNAAAKAGIPLPSGKFLSIEQVVQAQWTQYLNQTFGENAFAGTVGEPVFRVTDDVLQVVIGASSQLNAYQLKPVVLALEAAEKGLGWFVQSVLSTASSHAHEIYDMAHATYMLDSYFYNLVEFTDEAYALQLLEELDEELPEGPIPSEVMERLRRDYSYWPTDILKDVDGHGHLVDCMGIPGYVRPLRLSPAKARKWLAANGEDQNAPIVKDALELQRLFQKDKARAFLWDGSEDETETMGALCFLAWDDPALLFEAVSHYEQNQYNGGQAVEAFARTSIYLKEDDVTDAALCTMAKSTADYFKRWALLSKLLDHFPVWNDNDET